MCRAPGRRPPRGHHQGIFCVGRQPERGWGGRSRRPRSEAPLMTTARAFRGYRFPAEVILWAVRWYLQFPLSYRDLEAMLADRGVEVDHTTLYRWVQRFSPELERRTRPHLRPCRGPWH